MSTLTRPYCTLSDVQKECRNSNADVQDKLIDAINLASRAVEDWCHRDFWFHDHGSTPLVVKPIGNNIFLKWPVITLTSITDSEGTSYVEADGIFWDDRTIETLFLDQVAGLPDQPSTNRVSLYGTFGYTLASTTPTEQPPINLPGAITKATTLIAAAWSGEYRVERLSSEGTKVAIGVNEIPKQAKELLTPFKIIPV